MGRRSPRKEEVGRQDKSKGGKGETSGCVGRVGNDSCLRMQRIRMGQQGERRLDSNFGQE